MKARSLFTLFLSLLFAESSLAANLTEDYLPSLYQAHRVKTNITLAGISFNIPSGWTLHQKASDKDVKILGFQNGNDYLRLYIHPESGFEFNTFFSKSFDFSNRKIQRNNNRSWELIEGSYQQPGTRQAERNYIVAFANRNDGLIYYGFASSKSKISAQTSANIFLNSIEDRSWNRSLTDEEFAGKKYYFGWGAAYFGDPQMMHNEVKYDVLHTHDIFTKDIGGNYEGQKLIGTSEATGSAIKNQWEDYQDAMTWNDMYIQYSSGHGSSSGLLVGVTYDEISDAVLKMPAKEMIVFTMACLSGNLVDSFNSKKDTWSNWGSWNRTLMVMASSKASENSSTGPGTDPEESGGPSGSAGSAYGHSLWKALAGYSDGHAQGITDGFLDLNEIKEFTIWKTKEIGGHTPVVTGVYNANLIMASKPSAQFLASLEGGTEGLSDEEIEVKIQQLDREIRLGTQ